MRAVADNRLSAVRPGVGLRDNLKTSGIGNIRPPESVWQFSAGEIAVLKKKWKILISIGTVLVLAVGVLASVSIREPWELSLYRPERLRARISRPWSLRPARSSRETISI